MRVSRRVFLVGALVAILGLGAWGAEPEFTVAALNDCHVSDAAHIALLEKVIGKINENAQVELALVLGDISADGKGDQMDLAKQVLSLLKVSYIAIPGNHDVMGKGPDPYADYVRDFKERSWVRGVRGWTFIGLDSCHGFDSDVAISAERMAWLKEQLKKIPADRPIALFTHHPFNPHSTKYRVKNADEVLALFAGHNLKLVASGHWHGNQEETRGGILFTTTACCSMTRDNFDGSPIKGFRLFRFSGDTVATEFVGVE